MGESTRTPRLGARFRDALLWAAQRHANQLRKGTDIPYIGHLMSVASLVIEAGGSEDEAIAALLHDAAEDQGGEPTLVEIARLFGPQVTEIVRQCSDTTVTPKPPWLARKQAYLAQLPVDSESARLVALADKLHNARSVLADYRVIGNDVFRKFKPSRELTLWFYDALAEEFTGPGAHWTTHAVERRWMAQELRRVVDELCREVGVKPAEVRAAVLS